MTASPLGETPAIWGENAPLSLRGGLLAAGALAMAVALRFWLMAAPGIAMPPATARLLEPPRLAALPRAIPIADRPPPSASPADPAGAPAADSCPPLFSVEFGIGSDAPRLDPAALEKLADWMLSHPHAVLLVDGHADAIGSAASNFALSQRRAKAVADRFAASRLPESRITQRAFGYYAPLAGAAKGSSRNRRVVLSVGGTAPCAAGEAP